MLRGFSGGQTGNMSLLLPLEKDNHFTHVLSNWSVSETSNLYEVSPVFNVYPTKQVNYKVSSTAKNYTLLLSPNNPTEAGKLLLH